MCKDVQSKIVELRNQGYTVRVHHVRNFGQVAAVVNDSDFDYLLTRGEFDRAKSSGKLRYVEVAPDGSYVNDYEAEGDEVVYGKQVQPMGGFTQVTIEKDGKTLSKRQRSFNKQQFNKHIGLTAAFGRAYKDAFGK